MDIKTKSEKEYVYRYVLMVGTLYNLLPREVDVATAMVYSYRQLETPKGRMSKKAREEYNPMTALKKPANLQLLCRELGMSFEVFRSYVRKLKDKKFFTETGINCNFLPGSEKSVVTIWMQ